MSSSDADPWTARVRDGLNEYERTAGAHGLQRYELLEKIGQGGMAQVFRARDRELKRTVAVKMLREDSLSDSQARMRFHREAETAARLAHPNIVAIYDTGEDEGRPFIVMEFVEGLSFDRLLRERHVEMAVLLAILEKAARGTAHAHRAGVVHRDLKPGNILVEASNNPKVSDFGLAHLTYPDVSLTVSGAILGTPQYMSPEQIRGHGSEIGPHTDVYALGAILYEIVTGAPPHFGASEQDLYDKILNDLPVAPRRRNPKLAPDLETICLKALDKRPKRRYPTAADFADDLARFLRGEPILARPPSFVSKTVWRARRHPVASAIVGMLLLGGLGLAAVTVVRRIQFHRRIEDLLRQAEARAREGAYAESEDLYRQVKTLSPGHAVAERKAEEMRSAERKTVAAAFAGEGLKAREEWNSLSQEIARLTEERSRLTATIPAWGGEERKRPLWEIEKRIEEKRRRGAKRYAEMIEAFTQAVGIDPESATARGALAAVYFAEFETAERDGDLDAMELKERFVRRFDDGTYAERLLREGTLDLDSNPSGAEAEILRYEEAEDRRLLPRSYASAVCPIERKTLPSGSYLVILRKAGYRDVRYPVFLGRAGAHKGRVNLYTEEEIGEGFVYVPGGPFPMGGDREASRSLPLNPDATTGDFFIGKFEVTIEQYGRFLSDRSFHTIEEASKRLPRAHFFKGISLFERHGDDFHVGHEAFRRIPISAISAEDADAYGRWLSEKAGNGGRYRLPTGVEWEKAARGVDRRVFPWGNVFDWSFTNGGLSKQDPGLRGVEWVYPKDESPYGVRDMGGSMQEWCRDSYDDNELLRYMRGGEWASTIPEVFHAAQRFWVSPDCASTTSGFRVVKVPSR